MIKDSNSHFHLFWQMFYPISIDSSVSSYTLVEDSDVTCNRVWTSVNCESAAQQLGLSDTSIEDDII